MGQRLVGADQIARMRGSGTGLGKACRARCDDGTIQAQYRLSTDRADRTCSDKQVEDGAERETADKTDRDVALRVLRFFRCRRNRVEAHIRKEDGSRRADDPHPAGTFRAEPAIGRKGREVAGVQRRQRQCDECGERNDLDRDQDGIDARAFRSADDEQGRNGKSDDDRGNIDEAVGKVGMWDEAIHAPGRPRGQGLWQLQPRDAFHQSHEIA